MATGIFLTKLIKILDTVQQENELVQSIRNELDELVKAEPMQQPQILRAYTPSESPERTPPSYKAKPRGQPVRQSKPNILPQSKQSKTPKTPNSKPTS